MAGYTTTYTALAAYLIAKGWQLRGLQVIDGPTEKHCAFVFDAGAAKDAEEYRNRSDSPAPIKAYSEALKILRGMVSEKLGR